MEENRQNVSDNDVEITRLKEETERLRIKEETERLRIKENSKTKRTAEVLTTIAIIVVHAAVPIVLDYLKSRPTSKTLTL